MSKLPQIAKKYERGREPVCSGFRAINGTASFFVDMGRWYRRGQPIMTVVSNTAIDRQDSSPGCARPTPLNIWHSAVTRGSPPPLLVI